MVTDGILETVILAFLWAVAVWRAMKAVHYPRQRPLTVAFVALAIVMTLSQDFIASWLDEALSVSSVTALLKHLSGLVASGAVLEFISQMAGQSTGRRARRTRFGLGVAAGITMTAAFPFLPRAESRTFLSDSIGSGATQVYWGTWLLYLGTALALATKLCWRQARQAPAGRLRVGLGFVGSGTAVGMLYVLNKLAFVALGYAGYCPPFSASETLQINNLLLNVSLLLIVLGTTLPASFFGTIIQTVRDYRALHDLYPLWRALSEANPTVVLGGADRHRDRLDPRVTRLRLYRRTIEIRDCRLVLHAFLPSLTEATYWCAAHTKGMDEQEAGALVEAFRLTSAANAKARGAVCKEATPEVPTDIKNLDEEVHWLRMVARAHRSLAASTISLLPTVPGSPAHPVVPVSPSPTEKTL
ncbi:MAB_1171c family putative transporter [Streptomyces sp. NPDC001793]|uniref:MAB_1171c family putative transporter n=1 Tax=Streptomyces sp. NPDC001793 TaxID=3154657 RepID=UPI003318C1FA